MTDRDPNVIDLADHDHGPHWLQPSQADPTGAKRRARKRVRRMIRRALEIAAIVAAISSMAFVAGIVFPRAATRVLHTAALIAPAGIALDAALGTVAAVVAIIKWRNSR